MQTKKALDRAKLLTRIIQDIKSNGIAQLQESDIPLLVELKKQEDRLIIRYPATVQRRHDSREDATLGKPYWRERSEMISEPLLKEVQEYLQASYILDTQL